MAGWRRRRIAVIALSVLVTSGLAGCGDDDDDGKATPTTTPSTVAPVQGAPLVTVEMVDHAFQVSGPLVAGGTLRIANRGAEFHVLAIGRFKPGKTLQDLQAGLDQLTALASGVVPTTTTVAGSTTTSTRGATTTTARGATTTSVRAPSSTSTTAPTTELDVTEEVLDDIGVPSAFLSPGETVEVTVPSLQPGTHALLCFLPTEGESSFHFSKGMVGQLEVVAGAAPAPPVADATYRLAPGRAVEGPATLTAGRHTLKFEATPGSEDLAPVVARLNAGATYARFEAALDSYQEDFPPAKGAAGRLPGQVLYGGLFVGDVTEFYVTLDLRAGNHVIVAEDPDADRPGPPREIINVRVA